jgi:hypothetical protein
MPDSPPVTDDRWVVGVDLADLFVGDGVRLARQAFGRRRIAARRSVVPAAGGPFADGFDAQGCGVTSVKVV